MANFFLIDQSLKEVGGHHHDYVRCVASAAAQAGYLTTIGANQKFHDCHSLKSFGNIRKAFRDTTYQSDSYLCGLRHLTRTSSDYLPSKRSKNQRKGIKESLASLYKGVRNSRHLSRRKKNIRNFAADCERFFQPTMLTENDHAFFATINEMEFMGLAAFLSNNPRTIQVNWHLQFHFNLFDGRTPEYQEQGNVAIAIQNCFDAALARIPYHHLNFYTTSETLADQFNRLGVGNFKMLAYPVRPEIFESINPEVETGFESDTLNRPLRITCPGEVRREKKMVQYLQPVVDKIWEDHIRTGDVQIVVQRPVRKWPAPEKIELQAPPEFQGEELDFEHDWVQYFSHPLSDMDYLELIRNTDCGLLFYDSRAYFSRRAGVLSELLSCGKPVIVPAGSWLGDQLAEPNFTYADKLCNARNRRRTLEMEDLKWSSSNVPLQGGVVSFDQHSHPFEFQFELEGDETAFAVEFDWHWPQAQGVFCRFEVVSDRNGDFRNVQVIGHRSNGMSPVAFFHADQRNVHLQLSNAFHDSTASIRQFTIHTLSVDPETTARGSVGYIAADEADIPRAIDDIVGHYEHYMKTAKMFSQNWCRQHEPQQTFTSLVASSDKNSFRAA